MRLPNGYGSVYKVKGRRNPWRAVTCAPERKHVGYFATKSEAIKALSALEDLPNTMTVAQAYEKWSEDKYPTLTATRAYKKAFERFSSLHDKRFCEVKLSDIEKVFSETECSATSKRYMKILLSQLFDWGIAHDVVTRNYAKYISAPHAKSKEKSVFTKQEIKKLFTVNSETSQMILVSIYSGWRPSELLSFTLEGDIMKGGSKTDAGKDRIVPVHPKIKDFVAEYRKSYTQYLNEFKALMDTLDMKHTPHECRHTFITMAKEKGISDNVIKRIVGHANKDVTEGYTHRSIDTLRSAIAKIDWE